MPDCPEGPPVRPHRPGRGEVPADLVLRGGRVFDLITGDLVETDVAICGDTIVGCSASMRASASMM
jgi:adenine deaminase